MTEQKTIKTRDKVKTPTHLQDISKSGIQNSKEPADLEGMDSTATNLPEDNLTFYAELAEAGDIRDFKERIHTIVKRLGFSDFGFIRGECAGNELPLITNSKAQINTYHDFGFHEYDFVEQYRKRHTRPIFMSQICQPDVDALFDNIDAFSVNREILELNQSFGFFDYYHVLMKSSHDGENLMLAVSRHGLEPSELQLHVVPHQMTLKLLCQAIDYVCMTKYPSHFLAPEGDRLVNITAQPLRVLHTLANNDLTVKQLAHKLCLSPVTVHQHIATARQALGTRTNIAAVKKAFKLGLIDFD